MRIAPPQLSYQLESIEKRLLTSLQAYRKKAPTGSLLFIMEGEGTVSYNEVSYVLHPSEVICIPANCGYKVQSSENLSLLYYELHVSHQHALASESERDLLEGKYILTSLSDVHERISELMIEPNAADAADVLRYHIAFQQLILTILETQKAPSRSPSALNTRQAVADTIKQLERNPTLSLKMEQLAKQANLGRWQYAKIFKQLTGMNPHDYMTKLKMNEAKSLLVTSKRTVEDVALQVGYQDAYYFTRRFKQHVGISPKQFSILKRSAPKLACAHYAIESMYIGVQPMAAAAHERLNDQMHNIGAPGSLDLQALSRLNPDLIFVHEMDETTIPQLTSIAPTLCIPYWQNSPLGSFEMVAEALDRGKQAKDWVFQYEKRSEKAQNIVMNSMYKGMTAGLYLIHGEKRLIRFHAGNIGHVLFHTLGFAPPERIHRKMLEYPFFQAEEIEVEQFNLYEADIMFFIIFPTAASTALFQEIQQKTAWESFEAVKKNRVFQVRPEIWFTSSALSLPSKLNQTLELLALKG